MRIVTVHLLLCLHDEGLDRQLREETWAHRHVFEVETAESFTDVWRRLDEPSYRRPPLDAVLVARGPKQLSFEGFLRKWGQLKPGPHLLVLGDGAPRARHIERGSARHVVAQLYAALGLERSAVSDAKVVDTIGYSGPVVVEHVEWPGAAEPLVRARLRPDEFEREDLPLAQRHGGLAGPGVAPAIECFWDDVHPHTLHMLPPGISLARLEAIWWRPEPELALAFLRELVVGARTAHAAGASAGWLGGGSVWLGDDGAVTLVGVQLSQVPPRRPRTFGLASEAPPEEFHVRLEPRPAADAFRLGVFLSRLLDDVDPLAHVAPLEYLAGDWPPSLGPEARARPAVAGLIETLLQPRDVDRPRGELLFELIDHVAPPDARQRVAALVTWARAQPPWRSL